MAYKEFSYYYDLFNSKADYDKLFSYLDRTAAKYKCKGKILCDLGRGTGELSVRFCKAGYDVIAVDNSDYMLNVLYEKKYDENADNLLILKQDITKLDMFGTVDVFTCTFDTVNHLEGKAGVEKLFEKVSLFMDPNGVFLFDVNSPYKHREVLADNEFVLSYSDAVCVWKNKHFPDEKKTMINIDIEDIKSREHYSEEFFEYYYSIGEIEKMLKKSGLSAVNIIDGETFGEIGDKTQRYLFTAKKEKYV